MPTWAGLIFLAVVLDVWSRRIVGWAIGDRMTAGLVLAARDMALRRLLEPKQFTSIALGECCQKMRVRPSTGTAGGAYDNAMAESFFATLESELVDRRSWQTKTKA